MNAIRSRPIWPKSVNNDVIFEKVTNIDLRAQESIIFLSLTLSVTLLQIASSFLFLDGIELCGTLQNGLKIFDLGPLTPKIYSSKFAQNRL